MPKKYSTGFTLIELLIVVSVIGILAGIVITVLNPNVQRNRARDGVRVGNVSKIAQAVEAYNAAEGSYPADQATIQTTSGYIQNWPTDNTYNYTFASSVGCVSTSMATNTSLYFKYLTSSCTVGGVSCSGKVMTSCSNSCTSASPTSTSGCVAL